ncbi:alpha/beta hydrolase [Demequina sp. SYSU T00192]|uniref:Alpha/beta hydrolase n=1 Tax=Demequina litoralis TaxID=3051660 RepID=A0ABT8GBT2_9MICO|nr:alpha/beta hydrolase [Demequina sp. SYSU T00192]MDN4476594.1 alpha/beta hydrolase [Demequina sp. SYSU T00192]
MDTSHIHPELHEPLTRIPALDLDRPWARLVGRVGPRLRRVRPVPGVTVRWVRAGRLRLRIYSPASPASAPVPALLWIHGGGLVIGTAVQDDGLCARTAKRLGMVVVSVEYRLAPEHPFPAGLDDAEAAWTWLHAHAASLGIDATRVAIGGESAGGGLAAALAQRLHDAGPAVPRPVAQWLFAPMLDDRTAARTELDAVGHAVWDNRLNRLGWTAYLGGPAGADVVPPYAVPARRADLAGLPPAWLYAGDIELFHDEVAAYAARLDDAGVAVSFEVVEGAAHGFENWAASTLLARALVGGAWEWLAGRLEVPVNR